MPLTMAKQGELNIIRKIRGNEETTKLLGNLGFVTGGAIVVLTQMNGNVIVRVKGSRVAINQEMAKKIMI